MYLIRPVGVVLCLLMCRRVISDPVTINNGMIYIDTVINCTITSNDIITKVTGPGLAKGLHFGLIKYECGNIYGYKVSKLKCKDCGIFCNYNLLIEGCEQFWMPFMIGSTVGLLPIVVLCYVLRHKINKVVTTAVEWIIFKFNRHSDRKEVRKTREIELRTGLRCVPNYRKPMNYKRTYRTKVNVKRCMEEDKAEYIEIPINNEVNPNAPPKEEVYEGKDDDKNGDDNSNNVKKSVYPALPASALMAIAIISLLSFAEGCDNTLYVFSNGKVCDRDSCAESGMYDLPLLTGSVVCFKDGEGDLLKVKIDESYYRTRHSLLYYTSSYKLNVESTSNCKGAGDCWNGYCLPDEVKNSLKNDKKNGTVNGYGCGVDTLGCDTWCAHQSSCTWWKWSLENEGELASVYQRTSRIWETVISIEYKGILTSYKGNVNNPRINLDTLGGKIPLYITGFTSEQVVNKNGILIYKGNAYEHTVSDLNMPQTGLVGDYQISLDKKSYAFNEESVRCVTRSCKPHCYAPEPKASRAINSMSEMNKMNFQSMNSGYMIETKNRVYALIKVIIGNVTFNNLQVEKAQCNVEVISTFSCTGCIKKPYIILQAHNIKQEGILPIVSNCSFEQKFISCSRDPYELAMEEYNKDCFIMIPGLNKTIHVNFEFTFKGQLDPSKPIYGMDSDSEVIRGLMTSPGFITGFMGIFTTVSIIGLTSNIILRFIKVWQYNTMTREQMNKK